VNFIPGWIATQEQQHPQGTVAISYDNAGRHTQLTLPGGMMVPYSGACSELS
jgi:hypothetical protein